MNSIQKIRLPDVQASADERNLVIQRVGVKSVRYPVHVATLSGPQPSIGMFDMYVRLPADVKGTHMSRFLEVLETHEVALDAAGMELLLRAMLDRLDADSGMIAVSMPVFLRKTAPVSGVESLLDYEVTMRAEADNGRISVRLAVQVPVTSLCPCSKKISDYGAHNQRSHIVIAVDVTPGQAVSLEELVRIAESSASCELWGLLKRPDEKYVTERAYENPKFVEDLVRDIAAALNHDPRIVRYEVSSENFESIHNHSAYAWIEGPQAPAPVLTMA